ncbi:hypothetical protein [Aeromonas veronii]|uniref:hypothetical protein n=1 Tax=Aeromonas veronii TaxID=654 RepID=UPI003D1C2AAE
MNAIKLSPNWLLQLVIIVTVAMVTLSVTLIFTVNQTVLALTITGIIFMISIVNIMSLRFLHCYKAGIYYSQGLGKKYINADEIVDIQFHALKLLTMLVVTLENQQVVRFYNWQFDARTQQSIKCWYRKNKSSCNKLQQTPCNA